MECDIAREGSRIIDSPDCLLLFTVLTVVITVLDWTTEASTYISCVPFYTQSRAQRLGEWEKDWDSLFAQPNCRWRWHFCGEKQMERESKKERASRCLCVQKKERKDAYVRAYVPICVWLCIRAVKQLVLGFRLSELKVIPLQLTCLFYQQPHQTAEHLLQVFSFFLTFIILCVFLFEVWLFTPDLHDVRQKVTPYPQKSSSHSVCLSQTLYPSLFLNHFPLF